MMDWVSAKLQLAVKFCISQDIINIKHLSLKLQFDPHTEQIAEKCHLFQFTQLLLICYQWVPSGWVAGHTKIPMLGIGSAVTPLSKSPPGSLCSQELLWTSGAQFGFFFPCIFCCVEESTNGCDTSNCSRRIWMSGIHHLSLLVFQPIYLIFMLLAQRWKSWEQILRYDSQSDLLRQ